MSIISPDRHIIVPIPALHLREAGPLVAGFRTNWCNVGERHGKTRFRIRAYHPDLPYVQRVLDPLCKVWVDDPEDAWEFFERIHGDSRPSWFPALEDNPGTLYAVDSVTFLTTTGTGSYTTPVDWDSAHNHIECIGGGSGQPAGSIAGGGGGGYAKVSNLSISGSISYNVGAGTNNSQAGHSYFNGASLAASSVGGAGANTGSQGGGSSVGTTLNSGGNGGSFLGGGGAGGPNGAGAHGGDYGGGSFFPSSGAGGGGGGGGSVGGSAVFSGSTGGSGGNNSGGTGGGTGGSGSGTGSTGSAGGGGGGGGSSGAGGAGGAGTDWDSSHGSGGAGGSAGLSGAGAPLSTGGAAGLYGAGSGPGTNAPLGAQGIIVVTYTPKSGSHRMFSVF